jgi:hypothetical protein
MSDTLYEYAIRKVLGNVRRPTVELAYGSSGK